mmetsp:Transcript_15290/g.53755  ORF Transcript_15290/g.53755 Transcript_15290/m.53755 type:complete len:105 (+) Transcript_15290:189-503(+)
MAAEQAAAAAEAAKAADAAAAKEVCLAMQAHEKAEKKCRGVMSQRDVKKHLPSGMEMPDDYTCQHGYTCEKPRAETFEALSMSECSSKGHTGRRTCVPLDLAPE